MFYPKIVVSPPGPRARELIRKDEQFVSPSYLRYYPLVVESANDCIVKDVDGNEYIDFNSGIACMNVGHTSILEARVGCCYLRRFNA
jgi:4-aminobutyrate aminotransferase